MVDDRYYPECFTNINSLFYCGTGGGKGDCRWAPKIFWRWWNDWIVMIAQLCKLTKNRAIKEARICREISIGLWPFRFTKNALLMSPTLLSYMLRNKLADYNLTISKNKHQNRRWLFWGPILPSSFSVDFPIKVFSLPQHIIFQIHWPVLWQVEWAWTRLSSRPKTCWLPMDSSHSASSSHMDSYKGNEHQDILWTWSGQLQNNQRHLPLAMCMKNLKLTIVISIISVE